ncbi:MAG: lipocalin family protein, partial [Muribaculaceae bacterium]|nr:lipocalin family protein [Muribaculaceae bacterium]
LVEFDFVSGNWSEHGTYSVKDNIMTRILSDGDVEVYTILTLTQNKMITRYEGSYVGQYPNQYDEEVEDWTRVE